MTLANQTWRVLLVDDHPLVRNGLRAALLMALPNASIDEAGSAEEAMGVFTIARHQIVVLDVNLPGMSGLELARQLRAVDQRVRMVMIAGDADAWTVREALARGASGFVAKTSSSLFLSHAVLEVIHGREYLCEDSRAMLQRAGQSANPGKDPPGPAVLSQREREVLKYLAQGENTKNIADILRISPKTVETHRQHIMRKLRVNNLAALTRYAIRHNLASA